MIILIIVGLAAILIISRFMGVIERPGSKAPRIEAQNQVRSFTVLAIGPEGYKVRDLNTKAETILILPSSVPVALGDIIVVKKYIVAANGLVADMFDVRPPVPTSQPPKNLPKPKQ